MGVKEHSSRERRLDFLDSDAKGFSDVVEIDAADIMQTDRKSIGGRDDDGGFGRMDHPLGENRAMPGFAGLLVVFFDRGDQPDIRVIGEGC